LKSRGEKTKINIETKKSQAKKLETICLIGRLAGEARKRK
jgi:hypothetical protein